MFIMPKEESTNPNKLKDTTQPLPRHPVNIMSYPT
jgi:hypothetical protein